MKNISATTTDKTARTGVVLIVVLVLVMMIAMAGFGFLSAMTTEYEAAKINGQLIQAQQTLASAQALMTWAIELPQEQRLLMGGLNNQPELFRGRTVKAVSSTEETSGADLITSRRSNTWQFSILHSASQSQQSNLQFGLQNESSRLHMAMILEWEDSEPGAGREALMHLPGMTEAIADSLLDWVDSDNDPREFGAETDYYQRLNKPYNPRNGIPETLDELLFVKGVTRELLHGSTTDPQGQLGLGEDQQTSDWTQLLTCSSAEQNLNPEREAKINLNASGLPALQDELSEYLDDSLVRYILLGRQYGISFDDSANASQPSAPASGAVSGVQPSEFPFSISTPSKFTITSSASLIDSYVDVTIDKKKTRVMSPVQSADPEFPDLVEILFSRTTTTLAESLVGRINIHQASETVLNTLPEMTEEMASQIIQERESLSETEQLSTAWLVSRQVVEASLYRQWADYITIGGDVFTGEIVVFRNSGGPFLRRKLTIDASKRPASPVDWIDLTDQGLPVPLRLLSRSEID
ncbi:MAG: general secretion pathway protein GspK [Planctomycetaceae bacterium]|nr:general secretion pathway protein GspK [Planctomycetaceae bacterium]